MDLGALLDNCTFGMTNSNFLQICTKTHCCKIKQLKSWVNSHTVPHQARINEFYIFLAMFDFISRATFVVQASVVRASSDRPLTEVSQKLLPGSRPNFMESYLSTISTDLFFFIQFFTLQMFTIFSFFVNMGPHGSKNFKTLLLLQFWSDLSQTLW